MPVAFAVDHSLPFGPAAQIKAQLRNAIRTGEARPGALLPRVRELAATTGLNANTIAAAYRDLAREGLIVPRGKGGTRVAPGPFFPRPGDDELRAAADRLIAVARRQGRSGAEVLQLVAGRWFTRGLDFAALAPRPVRRSVYELLAARDHDDG